MAASIEIRQLDFSLNHQKILDNISLTVPEKSIYGFIGHNGAGKTTTIKLILGLLKAPENTIKVLGKDITKDRIEILKKVGSLVEQPAIYPHMTGWENLKNRSILLNLGKNEIDRVASITKISTYLDKKAGKYSLGMKQRLGIALALLNDPELLILDEPTNGLDPTGIHEIRSLLLELCHQHGKTVFISSHLLSEIEKIVTHIGIIRQGKMQFEGTLKDLPSSGSLLEIQCNDLQTAQSILAQHQIVSDIVEKQLQLNYQSNDQNANINKMLVDNGLQVWSLSVKNTTLEDIYLEFQK